MSDDDGEETTKAPETTKPEETTKPDEETTKPEEETEGPTEPPTTTAKPFDPDTDCGFENGTGKKEKVQWKGKVKFILLAARCIHLDANLKF